MNIFKRFIGSLLDKIILIFLFGFLLVFILPFSGETLGIFLGAVLNEPTSSYPWTEAAANNVYSLEEIDHEIVYSFTILNMLYYFICESAFKASPGKYIMGGRCVDIFDNKVDMGLSLRRATALGIFIFIAIQFRAFVTIISYTTTIIIFFLIIDIPVLFRKRSLIDIVTGTYYKDAKSLIQEDVEGEENDSEKTDKIVTVNYVDSNERAFNENENDNIILSDKKNENESVKEETVQKKNNFLIYIIPLFLCICLFSCLVIYEVLPILRSDILE